MIQGIHHVAMIVSSEDTVEFYKELGFQETFRKTRFYDTIVLLSGHDFELEMFVDSSHPAKEKPEPLGLRHLALKVDNIEATAQELHIAVGEIMLDWVGKRFCFVYDPDGNVVELHE
jgi:glyoxylase I family protein